MPNLREIKPVLTFNLDAGKPYLLNISGEWFVGGFRSDTGYLWHTAGRGMWDDYTLEMLCLKGLLLEAYEIKD